jgi:hypothetical protein
MRWKRSAAFLAETLSLNRGGHLRKRPQAGRLARGSGGLMNHVQAAAAAKS